MLKIAIPVCKGSRNINCLLEELCVNNSEKDALYLIASHATKVLLLKYVQGAIQDINLIPITLVSHSQV